MEQIKCINCASDYLKEKDGFWVCSSCGAKYRDDTVQKEKESLRSLLDEQKREMVENLRVELHKELQEEFINSAKIVGLCREIKKYLPKDFRANFYETANKGNRNAVIKMLNGIDVIQQEDYLQEVLAFMIRSLKSEYLLPVSHLIDRACKEKDYAEYEQLTTLYQQEAKKVEEGVYETKLPRDVFVLYSSKDMKKVLALVDYLERQDISCFVALRNLQHGRGAVDNYQSELESAIKNCKVMVMVSSVNSRGLDCDVIQRELPYIKEYHPEKPRVQYRIGRKNERSVAGDPMVEEYFGTLEYCYSPEEVAKRVVEYVTKRDGVKYCARCRAACAENAKFCAQCGNQEFVGSLSELTEESDPPMIKASAPPKESDRTDAPGMSADQEGKQESKQETKGTVAEPALKKSFYTAYLDYLAGNYDDAYRGFSEGSRVDDIKCQVGLAQCLHNGYGTGRDTVRANGLFIRYGPKLEELALGGDPHAKMLLGVYQLEGYPMISKNPYAASRFFKKGQGTKDPFAAVEIFMQAAKMGSIPAILLLAQCHIFGIGTVEDHDAARTTLSRLTYKSECADMVNYLLAEAERREGNRISCLEHYSRAVYGVAKAAMAFGELMTDEKERLKYCLSAANKGLPEAQYKVAELYRLSKDIHSAHHWYHKAAERGNANALCRLGQLYSGKASCEQWPKNKKEGKKYLQMAAAMETESAENGSKTRRGGGKKSALYVLIHVLLMLGVIGLALLFIVFVLVMIN